MTFEQAVVLHQLGFVSFRIDGRAGPAVEALRESATLFESLDHDWGVSLVESMLASVFAASGDLVEAEASQQRALVHARRIDSHQQMAQALTQLALLRTLQERPDDAISALAEAIPLLVRGQYRTDGTYALDALAFVALAQHDLGTAAQAAAVAHEERDHLGVQPWPTMQRFIDQLHQALPRGAAFATPALTGTTPAPDLFDALVRMLTRVGTTHAAAK
jgi:hypothetical protein